MRLLNLQNQRYFYERTHMNKVKVKLLVIFIHGYGSTNPWRYVFTSDNSASSRQRRNTSTTAPGDVSRLASAPPKVPRWWCETLERSVQEKTFSNRENA